MINLYPYNYYFLYFSIGILAIFIIVTLSKLMAIPKTLEAKKPAIENLERQVKLLSIKSEAINEKQKEDSKMTSFVLKLIPVLLAIEGIYRKDDSLEGVSGVVTAAQKYINQDVEDQKLISRLKKKMK